MCACAGESTVYRKAIRESGSHPAFQSRVWQLELAGSGDLIPAIAKQVRMRAQRLLVFEMNTFY